MGKGRGSSAVESGMSDTVNKPSGSFQHIHTHTGFQPGRVMETVNVSQRRREKEKINKQSVYKQAERVKGTVIHSTWPQFQGITLISNVQKCQNKNRKDNKKKMKWKPLFIFINFI